MSINVENLSFAYEHKPLLESLNFKIEEGAFFGILGPNGSGKSTLMKNMLGILKPSSGSICFFDKNVQDYGIKELAKIIGFVPQKSELMMPLLVQDVLLMGRYSALQSAFASYTQQDLEQMQEVAEQVRIENFLTRNILSLSGGEFQRVLLARALLKKPQILLLDEPTSALDMNYAIELLSLCENLLKKQKITVVAILHDLNLASMFCDEIIFLKEGKLSYKGSTQELFTKEILKEIYDLNCEVLLQNNKAYILPLKEK